jgi:nucleotide-binding universal stress UspA family protein
MMSALNSILAATDFSAPARHAAQRAARLANEAGAALHLMHALPAGALHELQTWLGAGHAAALRVQDEAQRRLDELAADLRRHARHARIDATCASGQVLDAIDREAAARDADLLVLGARGESFLRRLVLGTTAERLLRRTTRPVLVVRQLPHERYRRVLVAVDFSPGSEHALAMARRVAPQAQLVLCHAWAVPFEGKLQYAGVDDATIEHYRRKTHDAAQRRLQALAGDAGLAPGRWEPCIVEGDASRCLVEQEQERNCDLVAVGKHGQSATEDLLLGSVTKHVLAEGSADVLVSTRGAAPAPPA